MAYSTNPVTVERMLQYLEPLKEGGEVRYRAPGRARWLAYRIREALAVSQMYPQRFPEFAEAAPNYRIEVRGFDEVHAVLKPRVQIETAPLEPHTWDAKPYVRADAVTSDIFSPEQIVQEWQREGRNGDKLYFPNADLGPQELLTLYEWAQEVGVLIFENLGAITLLPLEGNEDTAEFAWSPDELDTDAPRLGE